MVRRIYLRSVLPQPFILHGALQLMTGQNMDHLAGCRCIIPGVLCDREWDQEEIVKNIVEKYQRGRERHCVGSYCRRNLASG